MANLVLNGRSIDSLDESAENFVDEDIIKAFENGVLVDWLEEFGYDDEVGKIREITSRENIINDIVKALGLDESVVESSRKKILNERAIEKERTIAAAKQKETIKEGDVEAEKEEECIITEWKYSADNGFVSLGGGWSSIATNDSPAIPQDARGSLSIPPVINGAQVDEILPFAFSGCKYLTSVFIPNSVRRIRDGAFSDCRSLKVIDVDSENAYFTSVNGLLLTKDSRAIVACPGGMVDVVIPECVESIASLAFFGCGRLVNVFMPNSVRIIHNGAFSNCSSLMSIEIDVSNTEYTSINGLLLTKEGTALIACPGGLTSVVMPESVNRIRERAFSGCRLLKNVRISNNVKSIADLAFSECVQLESVMIPASVRSIGWRVFSDCRSLKTISFLGNSPEVNEYSFFDVEGCIAYVPRSAQGWPEDGSNWNGLIIKKI